ncbi:uncharacterized protein IL334_000410 [Kwoniella shivajii]|uniref:Proline dehydrogenase n=1 Tax=Kwoniella shivajii TaxID=564305 RepID=A0ABZ1CP31_9TREE|nr:hypothetical protein IL334_000410 [Kwoniella shivajii]
MTSSSHLYGRSSFFVRPMRISTTNSRSSSPRITIHIFRQASSKAHRPSPYKFPSLCALRFGAFGAIFVSAVLGLGVSDSTTTHTEDVKDEETKSALQRTSTLPLLRSYLVWTLLGIPLLVNNSPSILDILLHSSIPGISFITETVVRSTFFAQFIPGETAKECAPILENLRTRNIGTALNYSAEADTVENTDLTKLEEDRFREIERALNLQGDLEERMSQQGWGKGSSAFALKVTGLIDPDVVERASTTLHRIRSLHNQGAELNVPFPGCPSDADGLVLIPDSRSCLTEAKRYPKMVKKMEVTESESGIKSSDIEKLKLLWDRLDYLTDLAQRNGIRLILDAEETYYQPAIDGYARLLCMKYNRPRDSQDKAWTGPVIYNSYQCYLIRQPEFLAASIQHAEDNGYSIGLKVVRGGYIVKEQAEWKASGKTSKGPIWADKSKTDECYNKSVNITLETLKTQLASRDPQKALSVIFGTHNTDSLSEIFDVLERKELASRSSAGKLKLNKDVSGKVGIAQLYGMREDLSEKIHATFEESKVPISMIFIAYGRLREVLPFLGRRAIENKSLMSGGGGAAAERRRVGSEIRRRLTFGILE